ncbi:MAG: hypothetical protein HYU64_00415 [Armatimonadetes bacterium]|nr:hypothetical protein [Armatimonadota bacterium]
MEIERTALARSHNISGRKHLRKKETDDATDLLNQRDMVEIRIADDPDFGTGRRIFKTPKDTDTSVPPGSVPW